MSIVHDFAEIAKEARLRALEGFNQNEVKGVDPGVAPLTGWAATEAAIAEFEATGGEPVEMPCDSNPQDAEYFYGVGFTAPEQDGA